MTTAIVTVLAAGVVMVASFTGTASATGTSWNATGSFAVGRSLRNGVGTGWFPSDIDAVRVRQGVVSPDEMRWWMAN